MDKNRLIGIARQMPSIEPISSPLVFRVYSNLKLRVSGYLKEKTPEGISSRNIMLLISLVIFTAPFIVSRYWFFVDYPVPGIYPDTASYYYPTYQIETGELPNFAIRPPLYPLLMFLVYSITDRIMPVIAIQNILTLLASVVMIFSVHRTNYWLSPFVAVGLAGWATGSIVLEHDTFMLSESLYASCLLFAFSFLLNGLVAKSRADMFLASLAMGGAIWTRPAGMFLLPLFLLVLAYIIFNRFNVRTIISFTFPLVFLIVLLAGYNRFTVDSFTVSSFGETNLAMATYTFWETNDSFPDNVNAAIQKSIPVLGLTDQDRHALAYSWDAQVLAPIFLKGFNWDAYYVALASYSSEPTHYTSADFRAWTRVISFNAIKEHPVLYAKFVLTFLELYYRGITYDADFLTAQYLLPFRIHRLYIDNPYLKSGDPLLVSMLKDYADPPKLDNVVLDGVVTITDIKFEMTKSYKLFSLMQRMQQVVFSELIWSIACLAAFIASAYKVWKTRFRDRFSFYLLTLTLGVIGASLVTSLVEYSQPRYSYPMEFAYFVAVALSPLLSEKFRAAENAGERLDN